MSSTKVVSRYGHGPVATVVTGAAGADELGGMLEEDVVLGVLDRSGAPPLDVAQLTSANAQTATATGSKRRENMLDSVRAI
ncbi:MAG: hypothetical protein ABI206_03160 [Antricoccus sp.]